MGAESCVFFFPVSQLPAQYVKIHTMHSLNPFYVFTALFLGMLHALEPGHGKSLITTFILSTNTNKKRDALLIGLVASIIHTASVYLLGFISLKVIEIFSPTNQEIFISFLSSTFIFLIGLYLIWDRIVKPYFKESHGHHHEHDCSAHKVLSKSLKATSILTIGLTAGLVPCSGGLTVFMTATTFGGLHSLLLGFFYVLSFSIGLGLALSLVALIAILGKGVISSKIENSFANIEKSSGVISAIIIYTLGVVLLTTNITNLSGKDTGHKHKHCTHCAH